MVYGVTAGILLAYLVLVWFIGTWLHPPGSGIWVLRGALAVIGIIAAGSFLWFYRKSKASETAADAAGSQAAPIQDIELLVNEAMRRLKTGLSRAASSVPVLSVDEERWEDNRMIFRVRALGQAAAGHVDVAEDHVQVEVVLPWLLQRFAEVAQAAIQNRGKLLLTKKS